MIVCSGARLRCARPLSHQQYIVHVVSVEFMCRVVRLTVYFCSERQWNYGARARTLSLLVYVVSSLRLNVCRFGRTRARMAHCSVAVVPSALPVSCCVYRIQSDDDYRRAGPNFTRCVPSCLLHRSSIGPLIPPTANAPVSPWPRTSFDSSFLFKIIAVRTIATTPAAVLISTRASFIFVVERVLV